MGLGYTRAVLVSESDGEAQAPSFHGTQSKERLAQSITECESLRQTIKMHEAFLGLTKRLLSLKSALDDVRRDVRHRNYCRTSPRQGDLMLALFDGIRRHAATTRTLFSKCLESARRPSNNQEQLVMSRMLGEGAPMVSSTQPHHTDQSLEELAQVDRGEYFNTKDEGETLFAHHANDIAMYSQFLRILEENEKRGKRKRRTSQVTPVSGKQSDNSPFGTRRGSEQQHRTTFGPAIELRTLETGFMEKIFPRKDDHEAIKFWVAVVGEKVYATTRSAFLQGIRACGLFDSIPKDEWPEELFHVVDPTSDNIVSLADFATFLGWFGPFKDSLTNLQTMVKQQHFFGSMSSIQAQELLAGQPQGTYIVRFNDEIPGMFFISCVQDYNMGFEEYVQQQDSNQHQYDPIVQATSNQPSTQTYHFIVKRIGDYSSFVLTGEDIDARHKTIQSLIDQYSLTFKQPFVEQKKKYDPMDRYKRHKKIYEEFSTEEEEDEDDMFGLEDMLKMLDRKIQRKISFAGFRGRVHRPLKEKANNQKKTDLATAFAALNTKSNNTTGTNTNGDNQQPDKVPVDKPAVNEPVAIQLASEVSGLQKQSIPLLQQLADAKRRSSRTPLPPTMQETIVTFDKVTLQPAPATPVQMIAASAYPDDSGDDVVLVPINETNV